jgi:hypothetical protein
VDKDLKPHWLRLIRLIESLENGEITLKFQNGLPIVVVKAEGRIEGKELGKE